MNRHIFTATFALGAMALVWVAAGFFGTNLLALMVTLVISAVYGFGAFELHRFRQATASLSAALSAIPEGLNDLADEPVGSDEYIHFAGFKFQKRFLLGLSSLKPVDIFYLTRKIFQPFAESFIMLQGQYRGRNEYCHLLVISNRLKSSPDSDFRFSESNIATYKPVHRH